jgi:hypothetical protein
MDLDSIVVQDFKDLFFRDFPYLVIWDATKTYNTDKEVYYSTNELFYKCLNDGVTSLPTVTTDWDKITDDIYNYVLDADIEKAFTEAQVNFNQSLFGSDANIQLAYLYLTAHFLVVDLRRSSQGVNSKGDYSASSQSVGSVSESLHIPDKMANNPIFQLYTTTGYGMKYLNLVLPRLVGNVGVIRGNTVA